MSLTVFYSSGFALWIWTTWKKLFHLNMVLDKHHEVCSKLALAFLELRVCL